MGTCRTTVFVPGPREAVFDLFTDREGYGRILAPIGARLTRPGTDSRQGPGAVHKVGVGPVGISEQITALEPGRRLEYRAVTPLPVRHYIGIVEFADDPRGTRVDYTLDVESPLPLPGPVLALLVRGLAVGLARGATRELRRR